jgi:hypothetical protein
MLRGSLCALLLLFYVLSAYAQRVVGVTSVQSNALVHSYSASHSHPLSNNVRAPHSRSGIGHTHRHHTGSRPGSFPYLFDLFGDYGIGSPEDVNAKEESKESPEPLVRVYDETPQRAAIQPSPAQLIEIPNESKAAHRQPLPATIFVLMSGERVETQRYLLTASSLSATVQHSQRTIPLEMLDLQATLAANRERGLDLRIPENRNEVSVRF